MPSDRNAALRGGGTDRFSERFAVSRRRAVHAGVIAALSLSGCVDAGPSTESGGMSDDDAGDDPKSESTAAEADDADPDREDDAEPTDGPRSAVRAFLEAAVDEDLDRMSEVSHSKNPFDPAAWVEDGWEFRGGGDEEELDEVDLTVVDDEATVADVFAFEDAAFWFEEAELEDALDGEEMATVEIAADDPTEDDALWLMATEDGEWRYLLPVTVDETPDDPAEAFEEPIEDEDDDVVVEIDWEHDGPTSDVPQAAVVLTEERGVDADRIEAGSTIEGASTAVFDRDDDEFTATWDGGTTLYVPYDADGDQIVVTAITETEDESEVVHREHYEP